MCFRAEMNPTPTRSGEAPIGVDIGERHILGVTAYGEGESMLVSGAVVRRNTFDANIVPYAIRYCY
nr:hypothetical protein [Haloquadratum walsbyi]